MEDIVHAFVNAHLDPASRGDSSAKILTKLQDQQIQSIKSLKVLMASSLWSSFDLPPLFKAYVEAALPAIESGTLPAGPKKPFRAKHRGKYKKYTKEQLNEAYELSTLKGLGAGSVAKETGVPTSTVRRIRKGPPPQVSHNPTRYLTDKEEATLVEWLVKMNEVPNSENRGDESETDFTSQRGYHPRKNGATHPSDDSRIELESN